ncbi:phosphoglycerate kinase [Rhodosalinus sp. K401]|uniref:phosphoglycerate kinase n=1 Tax=Rhodosalinus sp. K401 TaxID=3239195 RepID=UPI003524073E
MGWATLDDMALEGKRVLIRVDINVPVQDGEVTDASRIARTTPTIRDVLEAGGRPILLAHFDRPKGRRVPEMSLEQLARPMQDALGVPVRFCEACVGPAAEAAADALPAGEVLLLENTRFYPGEEANDADFAAALARLGDIYCNDAFSAAHRAHASTAGIASHLPSCAGRLMAAELSALSRALTEPERPLMAVVGGAKVSTKLDLLANLVERVDILVIGGGMANTFLAARGLEIGRSLAEHDMADTAREITEKAAKAGCEVLLPVDVVVARDLAAGAPHETVPADACPEDAMILDAGAESVRRIRDALERARTLLWNGPLGAFEYPPFDAATAAAAAKAAELSRMGRLVSVAGGGDTVAALNRADAAKDFTYISTAGGAFLEWMEGKDLPGVAALKR